MKSKILFIITVVFFAINPVLAEANSGWGCTSFLISIHNTSAERLTVNYELPEDAGISKTGIVVNPGEIYPLVTAVNAYSGILPKPHDNVWVGIHVFNDMQTPVFDGVIIKDSPREIFMSMGYGGVFYSVDPPGKIYKSAGAILDDAHYSYIEEEKNDGSCVDALPGKYTFAIGSINKV